MKYIPILILLLAGCGSDYEPPDREACERAGGLLLAQYKSQAICVRREAVIDERDLRDGGAR